MTYSGVKLGRTATFMKYLASVVSLIFLPKTLIWNFAELVENELMKSISKKNLPIFLFLSTSSLLIVKILRAFN